MATFGTAPVQLQTTNIGLAMQFSGIQLVRPSFSAFTVGVASAVGSWALLELSPLGSGSLQHAGATLAAFLAGCIVRTLGVDLTKGPNHVVTTVGVTATCFVLFHAMWSLF